MLKDINIHEYKCFKDLKVNGLSRINIISGKNNVGKTALMEAILIERNIDGFSYFMEDGSIFELSVIAINRNINYDKFKKYLKNTKYNISTPEKKINIIGKSKYQLNESEKNEIKKLNEDYHEFLVQNYNKELVLTPIDKVSLLDYLDYNSGYINSSKPSNESLVKLYSKIQTQGIQHKFLKYLQILDKNIAWIEPQLIDGEMSLRVNLANPSQSFLTSELGEGVNRYIEILAVLLSKSHTIIIDEIENGLHYSKLVSIAESIIQISKEEKKQVFITTHDKDIINAFSQACENLNFKDIRSIELYKDKENNIKSIVRNYEQFKATVDSGIELR